MVFSEANHIDIISLTCMLTVDETTDAEDESESLNATRYRNYAWRVKRSTGSIDISLLPHTRRRNP